MLAQWINIALYAKKASNETISGQWTFLNTTVDTAALIADVTTSGVTSLAQEWRLNGTTNCQYGAFFGFPGFIQPQVNSYIFFGTGDAVNYIFVDGAVDQISIISPAVSLAGAVTATSTFLFSNYRDDTEISTPASPAANLIRTFASDDNGITVLKNKDSTGFIIEEGENIFVVASNTTGSTLNVGDVVYINGAGSGTVRVALAKANAVGTTPALGLVAESIANGSFGRIIVQGRLGGLATAGFTAGQPVYLDAATAGKFTKVEPSYPNLSQVLGMMVTVHATLGVIYVNPGLVDRNWSGTIQNTFQIGDGTATNHSVQFFSGAGRTLDLRVSPTGARVLTLPDTTDTMVCRATTDTLTNKTLTAPTISDASNIVLGTTTGTKLGSATTQKLGFWNATPVVQQTVATITNNVTSGGTTDTIDNFTDLTTYSNDAAAIRNDIYQLARKLKLVVDALRTVGILG